MSQVKTMLAAGMPEDIEKGGKMDIRLLYDLVITPRKRLFLLSSDKMTVLMKITLNAS